MYRFKPAENPAQKECLKRKVPLLIHHFPQLSIILYFLHGFVIIYRPRHRCTQTTVRMNFWCDITCLYFWSKALLDLVDSEISAFRKHIGITWRIFLLFLLIKERIQATSVLLNFRTRYACSTKDMPIIQGNQQVTLQRKVWTNKLYKQNSNQKI